MQSLLPFYPRAAPSSSLESVLPLHGSVAFRSSAYTLGAPVKDSVLSYSVLYISNPKPTLDNGVLPLAGGSIIFEQPESIVGTSNGLEARSWDGGLVPFHFIHSRFLLFTLVILD